MALSPRDEWVENPFHLRSKTLHRRMRDGLLVPAEVLFEGIRGGNESLAVQRALGEWLTAGDELFFEALDRANAIRTVDPAGRGDRLRDRRRRRRRQRDRDLRAPEPAGRPPASRAISAAARLTGQMTNFRARAREALVMKELRGFSAPEGAEEGNRTGAFVDTDLLIRAALFLGGGGVRYRDAEKRKVQSHYQNIEASWDAAVAGFKSAVALFRNAGLPERRLAPLPLPAVSAGDRGGARPRPG